MAGLVKRVQESFTLVGDHGSEELDGWIQLGDWDGGASFSLSLMVPGLLPLHLVSQWSL